MTDGSFKSPYLLSDLLVELKDILRVGQIRLDPLLVLLVRDAETVGHLYALLIHGAWSRDMKSSTAKQFISGFNLTN